MVMDEQEKKYQKQTNIPETERWILVDSKSNPGRKYYFNPITKQKLWHHTDEEIKKKIKKTNISDQVGVTNTTMKSDVQNKNEVTTNPTIINSIHPNIPMNSWNVPFVPPSIPVSQPNIPLVPSNLPTAFINSPFLCNQIITQPTQAALINVQSDSPNTVNHIQNGNKIEQNLEVTNYPSYKHRETFKKITFQNTIDYNCDLRNKLINNKYTKRHMHEISKASQNIQRNVSWDEDIVKDILSFLRSYAAPNTQAEMWYIVPDTKVILKHSRFLTQLTVLDGRCDLKIPPLVRMELKHWENRPGTEVINRLIRFHGTEVDSDIQYVGDKFSNIVDTCRNLIEDKYHVVLLCDNDISFKKFKKELDITVFTVNKIIGLHKEGRLIPRTQIVSMETTSKDSFSTDNKTDKKLNNETIPEQPDPVNVESVSPSCNKLDLNKSGKKRLIRLKPARDENLPGGHPSKRKRWSAVRKKCQESGIAKLQSNTKNQESNDNMLANEHQECSLPEASIDEKDNGMVMLPKEQNDHCDVQSSSEPIVSAAMEDFTTNSSIKENASNGDQDQSKFGISKLLQTMVNILLRVLQQDIKVCEKDLSQIQIQQLHNATLDIIKNFSQYWIIVDAANKLSMKITQSTGSKGEVKMDQKFFEDVHCYGVHLLKVLQEKSHCPEDVKNIIKLLENICYNTMSNVGRPTDQLQEVATDYSKKDANESIVTETAKSNVIFTSSGESSSGECEGNKVNNCRTKKRKFDETIEQENVYFNALKLRKRKKEVVSYSNVSDIYGKNTEKDVCGIDQKKNSLIMYEVKHGNEEINKHQNIVYDTAYNEVLEDTDKSFQSEYKKMQYANDIMELQNFPDEDEPKDTLRTNIKSNGDFKCFIGMFLKEIREALSVCAQNFDMCVTHKNVNNDLSEKFEAVHAHLHNLRQSLDSILQRETSDVNNNFKILLINAGVDVEFDHNMCDEYRYIVQKCRNEVESFLKILGRKFFDQNIDIPLLSPQYV